MERRSIDLSMITSMSLSIIMIFSSIILEGNIGAFLNLPSCLIVIAGTLFVTISCFSFFDIMASMSIIYKAVLFKPKTTHKVIKKLLKFSESSRKVTALKDLEAILKPYYFDHFFSKAVIMMIDGIAIETIEKNLSQEINSNINQYNKVILIIRKAAETAPAMGLIGTLIGLVQMLHNLSNPSELGSAMAVSLLTTFYGAILSYMFFFPLASKVEHNAKEEALIQMLYLKAISSIAKKENPRYLENTLNSLLGASNKIHYFKS
jgi:chemotaxis protein MotA